MELSAFWAILRFLASEFFSVSTWGLLRLQALVSDVLKATQGLRSRK